MVRFMEPLGTLRRNLAGLKPVVILLIALFFAQGIAASYSSTVTEAKSHASIIKKLGAKSHSTIKKPGKQIALLRGAVFANGSTAPSFFPCIPSGDSSTAVQAAISARAPPAPIARHIS